MTPPLFRKAKSGGTPSDAGRPGVGGNAPVRRDGARPAPTFRACSFSGCAVATAEPCGYVDRNGDHCTTAWCPAHRITVEDRVFCRRHAGTMSALPPSALRGAPLPSLDNRAPSLVSWVAREIDADVRQLLATVGAGEGAEVTADPVFLISLSEGQRAWERRWQLTTRGGETLRVSVVVAEASDAEVLIRVGSEVIDRFTPPWIGQRNGPVLAPGADDAAKREQFNGRLVAVIGGAINRATVGWARGADGSGGTKP